VGFKIANCQMPIADWPVAEQTNWQSEIDNWQCTRPTRYREVVLTSWENKAALITQFGAQANL
jgi:hypothetical protein